ncbi:hypothetical protein [Bacillus sp. FSL R12-0069]
MINRIHEVVKIITIMNENQIMYVVEIIGMIWFVLFVCAYLK